MANGLREVIPVGFYLGNVIPGAGHLSGGSLKDQKSGPGHVATSGPARQKNAADSVFSNAAIALAVSNLDDDEKATWKNGLETPEQHEALRVSTAPLAQKLESVLGRDFNSITPENQGKWESIEPEQGQFYFAEMDECVAFAEANGQRVRGHALLWHNQNPQWLNDLFVPGAATDAELQAVLENHITSVVGRYAGRIAQWDVANEIINDDGTWRQGNPWIDRFGPEIVKTAFRLAHRADPNCQLFLNDYTVESRNPKSDAYYQICQEYLAEGIPLHGMGFQGHLGLQAEYPEDLQENLRRFTELDLVAELTEVDIRTIVSYRDNMNIPADMLEIQGQWYARLIADCLAVKGCTGVTIWGVSDSFSWIPSLFKGEGAPTLLDDNLDPKPAYAAVREALAQSE